MATKLPDEVLELVVGADVALVCAARGTCAAWREALRRCERRVAERYADETLGDSRFWERALARPAHTARPLATWHAELVRVHAFRRLQPDLRADDFYRLWRCLDQRVDGVLPSGTSRLVHALP